MLSATAVELPALLIQPLDGNNSPLLCTVTVAFICCMLCLILCTVLCFPIVPIQIIGGFTVQACVFRETIFQLVHPSSTFPCWSVLQQGSETPTRFVLQKRTDLQGSIKFHIILLEHISRKWWQSNYESATVKRHWDYHFTRGTGFFLKYTGEKSTTQCIGRFLIMDPGGKVASPF